MKIFKVSLFLFMATLCWQMPAFAYFEDTMVDALRHLDFESFSYALEAGANPQYQEDEVIPPLYFQAALLKDERFIKKMLEYHLRLNDKARGQMYDSYLASFLVDIYFQNCGARSCGNENIVNSIVDKHELAQRIGMLIQLGMSVNVPMVKSTALLNAWDLSKSFEKDSELVPVLLTDSNLSKSDLILFLQKVVTTGKATDKVLTLVEQLISRGIPLNEPPGSSVAEAMATQLASVYESQQDDLEKILKYLQQKGLSLKTAGCLLAFSKAAVGSGYYQNVDRYLNYFLVGTAATPEWGDALLYFLSRNWTDFAQKIIDAGLDINTQGGRLFVQYAAKHVSTPKPGLDFFLKNKANVNAMVNRSTPLNEFLFYKDISLIQKLLDAGADINTMDYMAIAANSNFWQAAILFFRHGGKLESAYMTMVERDILSYSHVGQLEFFELMLQHSFQAYYVDDAIKRYHQPYLRIVAKYQDIATEVWSNIGAFLPVDAWKFFLSLGVDKNRIDKDANTPVMKFAQICHLPEVTLLVESGADVMARNKDRKRAANFAYENKCQDVLVYLCKFDAQNPVCPP